MTDVAKKHRGAHAELLAAAWLIGQGYEVFRNVSQHGEIDIVAIKNGTVLKLDVKGERGAKARLARSVLDAGVLPLHVGADGACEIDYHPAARFEPQEVVCAGCGTTFTATRRLRKLCRKSCGHAEILRRRRRAQGILPKPVGSREKVQPWAAKGISRSEWYRRKKRGEIVDAHRADN